MLEILYRIYEVADEETRKKNVESDLSFGFYSSSSKQENTELLMDCKICDSREQFKDIIREEWGKDIPFSYRKGKLKPGDVYCIIIGEHCYDTEKYFDKRTFVCDCCHNTITTYLNGRKHKYSNWEIEHVFYGIPEYADKEFCSVGCMMKYQNQEREKLRPDNDKEFFITRDMFTEKVSGYIYMITKKSTGQFYVGQTLYAPIFRWGQHLKTDRFPIADIVDYKFEVIEIVPKGENILEREKYWIQTKYRENPELSLNIMCTANLLPTNEGFTEEELNAKKANLLEEVI